MKRLWPELAVILLGLLLAAVSLAQPCACGADCQCVNCQCPTTQFVTADDGTQYHKVCVNGRCQLVPVQAAKPMPKGPAPVVAKVQQTEEPPLAAGPVRTLVAVVWQKARVVAAFVLHPLHHRRHN